MSYFDSETDTYVELTYRKIVENFGHEIVLEVTDDDYRGDSRFLLRGAKGLGYLRFGWGSCSGCDALEACESAKEAEELAEQLEGQIVWLGSNEAARDFFAKRDWERTEYDGEEFGRKVLEALA